MEWVPRDLYTLYSHLALGSSPRAGGLPNKSTRKICRSCWDGTVVFRIMWYGAGTGAVTKARTGCALVCKITFCRPKSEQLYFLHMCNSSQ